ncbi:MAG: hypothetical protein NVSMB66_2930 [Candidatus Doudnabacteria bacterium]
MPRKVSKKIFLSLALTAVVWFCFSPHITKADVSVFIIHGKTDYTIDPVTFSDWKIPSTSSERYIPMEPERSLNNYVLTELGLKSTALAQADYEKYNVASIYRYIKSLEPGINRDPEDAKLEIKNDLVTEFNPGRTGETLDLKSSIDSIIKALDSQKNSANITILETAPLKDHSQANNLGIKELVAYGESNYSNSPNNRIFNIKVGVGKETGILIKPGEEFSFNKNLGPVDGEHGFLPELVIKKTGTVPEFGGGLCQVSSTVFRAAMNAGLPITARRNHSYAVGYYSPQGTDATIYPGVQDLKFMNDMSTTLLLWPELAPNHVLRFYLYGARDTRKVTFDGPHSYDRKPDKSLKAVWTRFVTGNDGKDKKDVFYSTYQSPALFHKVTTFPANVSTDPNKPLPPSTPVPANATHS